MGDNGSKLSGVEKPALNTGGSGDLKTQKEKIEEKKDKLLATGDQIKPEQKLPTQPPTDFKVAEIWIRNGRCMIDAPPEFWQDKCRALGLLEYCKDIVKEAKMQSPKIMPAQGSMLNFARKIFRRK